MAQPNGASPPTTVLVVDDHAVTRLGLIALLKAEFGVHKAHEAAGLDEALVLLENFSINLAIFDLGMPDLLHASELARVRRLRPGVRLVVLSGSHARHDILAALDAGVHGYIVKSARPEILIEKLRYVMSGEIYVPPGLADLPVAPDLSNVSASVATQGVPCRLSERQLQVLNGLVLGHSNKQIARALKLAEGTVKMHIGALFRALGATNRAHAAALGKRLLE